ncbi:hypothetical protein H4P12_12065 [Paracoccus sp. 11-3]|uniref:Alpha/beta hydrolase n=1 Tax=Paracoccus amoyensis TaxID=2760093 RepID=A0A926GHI6_9RHOB|nr:hypothetical protein [Paracoccus amoyensis]MBC9247429.1 hypothetical protein [Paracoccus amoyensis]
MLFHGNSANAAALRDFAIPLSELCGLTIAAPLFDKDRFPPTVYQRANITDKRHHPRPEKRWTTRLVEPLLHLLRPTDTTPYWLWGFSAGAQFLSRVAAFQDLVSAPQRIVIVSPSSHVLPITGRFPAGEAAPYGLGSIFPKGIEQARQIRYLERPITLCVGLDDREVTDPSLTRSAAAQRQGPDRLSRATKTYNLGAMTALRLRCAFNWQIKIVPGVDHSAQAMLDPSRAIQIIDLPEPDDASSDNRLHRAGQNQASADQDRFSDRISRPGFRSRPQS